MGAFRALFARELGAYYYAPLAHIFSAVFLIALGVFTWNVGRFFDTNSVDLAPFFAFHPWLFVLFLPALTMGLWSDEQRSGTIELLLTSGTPLVVLVSAKFLSAWTVAGLTLLLTVPMWWTANYLGAADNAAIATTYLVSFLMAGAYLSIGSAASAWLGSPVLSLITGVFICFLLTALGLPLVLSGLSDVFGAEFAGLASALSFLEHFQAAQRGILNFGSIAYFVTVILIFQAMTGLALYGRREAG